MKEVTRKYIAAGVSHYLENIDALSSDNDDYDRSKKGLIDGGFEGEKVYRYVFFPKSVLLQPEPDNPYDPNAVKSIVDGYHVGYIKKGSAGHIRKQLEAGNIVEVTADIGGGPLKLVEENDDDGYTLEKGEYNYWVDLSITEMVEEKGPSAGTRKYSSEIPKQKAIEIETPVADKGRRTTMYCRHCGKEIDIGAKFCNNCGASVSTGAAPVQPQYQQPVINIVNTNTNVNNFGYEHKSKWVAFFLCLILGSVGAHRFYVGKIGTGIIWLFTIGCFGFGWIINLIMILCGVFRDKSGQMLV